MRQSFRRRNGHSFDTDAAIARRPRWLSNPWVGKLSSTYERATNWVSGWITRRIRNWESQTSVSRRRRQVLLLFGVIGLGWIIRLIYLFYQLPALSTLVPPVGQLTKGTHAGQSINRQGSLADSVHKADYLEARSGRSAGAVTRSGRSGRSAGAVTRSGVTRRNVYPQGHHLPQSNNN